jgi:hypothetical protein
MPGPLARYPRLRQGGSTRQSSKSKITDKLIPGKGEGRAPKGTAPIPSASEESHGHNEWPSPIRVARGTAIRVARVDHKKIIVRRKRMFKMTGVQGCGTTSEAAFPSACRTFDSQSPQAILRGCTSRHLPPASAKKGSGELLVRVPPEGSLPGAVRDGRKAALAPRTGLYPGSGQVVDPAQPPTSRSTQADAQRKLRIKARPLPVRDARR